MAVSVDSVQVAVVEQAIATALPANPKFKVVRMTGEGIAFQYNSTQSAEMGGNGRGVKDSILTGGEVTGPINFELSKNDAFEMFMAAALGSDWGNDPLAQAISTDEVYVASKRRIFAVEKRWVMDDGSYDFHRFMGCVPDTLSMTITPGQPIAGSVGFMGSTMDLSTEPLAGVAYEPAGINPVMTAPLVTGIELFDKNGNTVFDVRTSCWTNVAINIANNNRNIPCIGTLGSRESVLGRFECTIGFSVYFTNDFLLESLRDQVDMELHVQMADALGNSYTFVFPRVRIGNAQVVAGGTGEDALVTGEMTALVGAAPKEYSLLVKRGQKAAASPVLYIAAGAGATSVQSTITFSGAAALGTEHITVAVRADTKPVAYFTHKPAAGATPDAIATAIAALIEASGDFVAAAAAGVITITPEAPVTHITRTTVSLSQA